MTDQQRGAYTPPQDIPLQFDPRSSAGRRPLPMALIASGTLLLVMVAAVALYYSRGVRGDNEPPRPVGEPVATLKTAPAVASPPDDPTADLDVAAPQNVPARPPAFAAAPEAPKPRPQTGAPRHLTVQAVAPSDLAKPMAPLAPAATPRAQASSAASPIPTLAQTVAQPLYRAPPEPPPAPSVAASAPARYADASPPPSAPAPAPARYAAVSPPLGAGARVQIGAFSSAALADRGWSDVAALMPGAMGGKAKHVEPVDKDGQTLYRTSVTGFVDRTEAEAFCTSLRAKGKICFVKS